MSREKTIAELEAAARKAELRAKELRAKAKQKADAERAKENRAILDALDQWRLSLDQPLEWFEVANYFYDWMKKNLDAGAEKAEPESRF